MNEYAIEIKNLVKSFGDFTLGPMNMQVPKGTVVGYIGENGAGKTTTIKLLLGLVQKDRGEIQLLGKGSPEDPDLKNRLGLVFDDLFLPDEVNLKQVEKFCSKVYKNWESQTFKGYQEQFALPESKALKTYSRGMRMKLSMAIALAHGADLLLLDEATSGLDPVVREEILDLLLDFMQDENHTVFMSSHILSDLEKLADYIAFIHRGKLLFFEEKDRLEESYGICKLSKEEAKNLDEEAIVGRRVHAFGEELLVKRDLVPGNLKLGKPSIEDIMVYFIKGGEKK